MKIVFATNNKHKLEEIRAMLGGRDIGILSLSDIGCHEDIPENGKTLEENAMAKALYVYDKYKIECFADDTGLEVDALGGEPGVFSARYAGGEGHDSEANMNKLLSKLGAETDRTARFRTVIVLATSSSVSRTMLNPPPGSELSRAATLKFFEGVAEGSITWEKKGEGGFGYDPIFQPYPYEETFAELGAEVKNKISHRAKATAQLVEYLCSVE